MYTGEGSASHRDVYDTAYTANNDRDKSKVVSEEIIVKYYIFNK